ncbi:MAG: PspC domain-containing protein [Myxococcota bacterium]|nr:PspC domain-containing protein [Myxococcota bacterium]
MSDSKQCPWCAETIRREAIKCRYCGSIVEGSAGKRWLSEPWVRPESGRMIAGVCAGLADQFGVSVTIVRLCFAVGLLFSGGTILVLYAILWVLMPPEEVVMNAYSELRRELLEEERWRSER